LGSGKVFVRTPSFKRKGETNLEENKHNTHTDNMCRSVSGWFMILSVKVLLKYTLPSCNQFCRTAVLFFLRPIISLFLQIFILFYFYFLARFVLPYHCPKIFIKTNSSFLVSKAVYNLKWSLVTEGEAARGQRKR
jgi:hypothetical protein